MLLMEVLRLEPRLGDANAKAIRRWAKSGEPPKRKGVRHRVIHALVGQALPASRFQQAFGLPRDLAVEVLSDGLGVALEGFDRRNNHQHWLIATAATIAFLMARSGVRVLERSGSGASAVAPRWIFAGNRQVKGANQGGQMRTVSLAARERVLREKRRQHQAARCKLEKGKTETADALRKQLDSMVDGASLHDDTIDRIGQELGRDHFRLEWALEEFMIRFRINPTMVVPLFTFIDAMADALPARTEMTEDNDVCCAVLSGAIYQVNSCG
ncbi:MAG: hypothetical protein ABIJ09_19990 [Pseudomonadota bacterium]